MTKQKYKQPLPNPKIEETLINTLLKLKRTGLSDKTLRLIDKQLRNLAKRADLFKPEEVKFLLEVGFEYVCQKDNLVFLRKRK